MKVEFVLFFANCFVLGFIKAYLQQEREAAMLAKKQSMYTLLEDDDVDNGGASGVGTSAVSESKTRDSKKKRFRQKTEVQDDEDDEAY